MSQVNFKALCAAVMVSVLGACSSEPPAPEADDSTLRQISTGEVVGYVNESGAQSWLGLPYAASTAGENRWRAPQPVASWSERFEALEHSEPCPQIVNALSAEATGRESGSLFGSEDCLKLDVYAPAGAGPDSADRPVMMWIHGGSNTWGYASHYDGATLAQEQNVVVVVIQYRLGPLGFFAHPATDTGEGANFALLDHVAALNWIQREIAQFGGDASNVTIFGESAGGHNVAALLASPLGADLFDRAIIQSGIFDSAPLDHAQNAAMAAAGRMGVSEISGESLRALPLDQVFAAYEGEFSDETLPRVIADGVTLPAEGLTSAFTSVDAFNAVPVITGTNRDEMKLFNAINPELATRRFGILISPKDPVFYDRLSAYQSRVWRLLAVERAIDDFEAAGLQDVWTYRFDWDEGGQLLTTDFSVIFGAAHGMEIPFVFNHFDFFGKLDPFLFHRKNAEGREVLAQSMGAYWAEFARTGAPGDAGGPLWPRATGDSAVMRFDSIGAEVIEGGDSLDALLADLNADPALTPEQSCAVSRALANWRPGLAEPILAASTC